jgi:hypothetical protein
MRRRSAEQIDIPVEEIEEGWGAGKAGAGQSGGSQGLSRKAEVDSESIEELADSGQALEADAVAGVEDAADHPEKPIHTHADYRRVAHTFPGKNEE